jgi:hypothetical protein
MQALHHHEASGYKQTGPGVRFIVRKHDVDIWYREMLIGLRAGQTCKQVTNDVKMRQVLVVRANHDPGR